MSRWLEREQMLEETAAFGVLPDELPPEPEEEVKEETISQFKAAEFKGGDAYKWKKGDSIYDIARRMNVDVEKLKTFNEIESLDELEPGIVIYKPVSKTVPQREIRYEFLAAPVDYHINKQNGAKKWRFGGAPCTWEEITSTGFYPFNTNVRIVAVAYVPIDDVEDPKLEAAYFMDSIAVGEYHSTGRITYTVGFMHSDLDEGLAVKVVPEPPAVPEPAPIIAADPKAIAVVDEQKKPVKTMDMVTKPKKREDFFGVEKQFVEQRRDDMLAGEGFTFMESYRRLEHPELVTAILPEVIEQPDGGTDKDGRRFVWIHDYASNRPDRKLHNHWEGEIVATFEYKGVLYGRPARSVENGVWFGIPMDYLESQDRLYNADVDTETKVRTGKGLSGFEKRFWVPISKWALSRKNKKNKE